MEVEQVPRAQRDERGWYQGTRSQHQEREAHVAPDLGEVERDGVAEQHEDERQRRERSKRRRLQREIEHAEAEWSERGAENEEDRDLWHTRSLDDAGQQRRDEDDDADEGDGRGEGLDGHAKGNTSRAG